MSFKIAKAFNTPNQRFNVGDDAFPEHYEDPQLTWKDRVDAGFIVEQEDKPADEPEETPNPPTNQLDQEQK